MIYSIGKHKSTSHFLKKKIRNSEASHNNIHIKKEEKDGANTIFILGVCPKKRSFTT